MAQTVKRLFTKWESWVRSLGREDPLEKGTATHSSILATKSRIEDEMVGWHHGLDGHECE